MDLGEHKRFLVSIPIVLVVLLGLYYAFTSGLLSGIIDECAGIEDPRLRYECYTGKAIRDKDPSTCDNIDDREACDECHMEVQEAILEKNRDSGGGSVGGDDSGGGESGEESEGPFEACEALSGNEKDWCIRNIAVEEGDPSVCLMVEDSYYRDSCYRFIALEKDDSSYCDYMKDEDRRIWCHEALD
ncbi:MAG: hypothetical protein JSV92_04050 [archaeon]|nr:MAG: hypothetical protein JSV92_04050 [archaeon]